MLLMVTNLFPVLGQPASQEDANRTIVKYDSHKDTFYASADSTRAEFIAKRLNKGIVLDVTPGSEGLPIKVLYDHTQINHPRSRALGN